MAGARLAVPRFSPLRNAAARLTLLCLVLVTITASALFALVHTLSIGSLHRQTDAGIQRELDYLSDRLRRDGPRTLRHLVEGRSHGQTTNLYLLSLVGPPEQQAGNLEAWPTAPVGPGGWMNFAYTRPTGGGDAEPRAARGRAVHLGSGLRILLARDIQALRTIEGQLAESFLWAGGAALLLGFAGGALIARHILTRIRRIHAAARSVLEGGRSRRLPEQGSGDELDRLSGTFNVMLERIEGLTRNLREVTDNLAHDLRTPLHRLRSGLETARRDEAIRPNISQCALDRAIAEADQLIGTFNGLLEIAQVESGMRPVFAPVDAALLVQELAEIYEPLAEESNLALFVHADAAPCMCSGHRALLAQSLSNLLDNAIKYGSQGGSIRISVRVGLDGHREFIVADHGPGIPESERPRVLHRFVRLNPSRNPPGSGLGLSLVEAVVRLHGGTLSLEDNGPGLRVRIRLPGTQPASAGSRTTGAGRHPARRRAGAC